MSTNSFKQPKSNARHQTAALESTLESLQAEKANLISTFQTEFQKSQSYTNTKYSSQKPLTKSEENLDEAEIALREANEQVKGHIKLLNSYNEIRDVGMMLLRLIADQRGVLLSDIVKEYELSSED